MGNSLRCCLACLLPCGAFDMIRIVHLNGQIDEYNHSITVRDILAANPNHIVSRPCSSQGQITIVSPDSELKRGKIYFLIPANYSTVPEKISGKKHKRIRTHSRGSCNMISSNEDHYLAEILLEGRRSHHHHHHRRRSSIRGAVWRPNLESIPEES